MTRILYVTHRVPFPPNRGDRIRTYNILKRLAEQADVYLACLADEPVDDATRHELERWSRATAIVPHTGFRRWLHGTTSLAVGRTVTQGLFRSSPLRQVVRRWAAEIGFDAAMASSSGMAEYVLPPVLPAAKRVWVDLIDVDSQKWMDYAEASSGPKKWLYAMEASRLRKLECSLAKRTQRLLVVSEAERNLLRSFCSHGSVQAIANGVDTEFFCPSSKRSASDGSDAAPRCAFVGVLNYRPNSDAVDWFVQRVWPQIRERYPLAQFDVIGRFPTPDLLKLDDEPGVNIVGEVDDVRPFLQRAAAVVVPLQIARGVQNKVLEAMAAGRPVVASAAPIEGLLVEPGSHVLQAHTPEEWCQCVTRLFADEDLRTELGQAARKLVTSRYRWETALEPLQEFMAGECAETGANVEEAVR